MSATPQVALEDAGTLSVDERATLLAARFDYQPALDGLRAIAVLAVLAYHGTQWWATGGFLGVDVFFVLSGYLITSLLLHEHRGKGRIRLGQFYARRARRLLPALAVLLFVVAAFGAWFWTGDQLQQLRADMLGAVGYVSNWRFIWSGQSYFDQFAAPSPLRHLWSLAIEEQWYFIWPALLTLMLRAGWRLRRILVTTVVLAAGSALLMAFQFTPGSDPGRLYYGTDTRAQTLLVGGALALILTAHGPIRTRAAAVATQLLGVAAAAYVLWRCSTTPELSTPLYRGGFLIFAIAVAVVITAAVQPRSGNPLRVVLSIAPLRWIGWISYGLYLWHWPIYLVLTTSRTGIDGIELLALRVVTTFAVSIASYVLVERPIRRGTFGARFTWGGAVAMATATGVVAMIVTSGAVSSTPASFTAGRTSTFPTSSATESLPTPAPQPSAGPPPVRMLYAGDSVMWALALYSDPQVDHDLGVTIDRAAAWECGLTEGPARGLNGVVRVPGAEFDCDWPTQWPQAVTQFRPDVSVLMPGAWDIFDREVDGTWLTFGSHAYDRYFEAQMARAIAILTAEGGRVAFLSSPSFERDDSVSAYEPWGPKNAWRVQHINELMRTTVAKFPGAYFIDFAGTFCLSNRSTCDQGRFDGVHYSEAAADTVNRWIATNVPKTTGLR